MASGVLVLVFGEATKLSGVLTSADKVYRAELSFGTSTDTLDAEGQVVEECTIEAGWADPAKLEAVLDFERQRTTQIPPQFSAIKQAGQPAYRRARRGEAIELEPRGVCVRDLRCLHFDDQRLSLELRVSKGYYVRSLARDVCSALGVAGHLSALRRLQSGCFTETEACRWPPETPPDLLSVEATARRALNCATLTEEGSLRARQGKVLWADHFAVPPPAPPAPITEAMTAWLDPAGRMLALGERDGEIWRVRRGFVTNQAARESPPRDTSVSVDRFHR
jgi:tRNA pseudouridine55 synthase